MPFYISGKNEATLTVTTPSAGKFKNPSPLPDSQKYTTEKLTLIHDWHLALTSKVMISNTYLLT